ncbi:unnamed protein product [Rotaria magnacalcarata]|uniref:Uncharacterized protein n=2 Tax=Rotaria TaxID=231623 RepID=A0A816U2Q9_9BILA|nr:unnamed protein product [Rotaria magnacalcarata]CAF3769449.1 unnamed protein product [Rotaria socialis]CAF4344912.1 unnamed protein product [Rotaria magnacalcarata]CAF4395688.1 unnamed protein product [Rotaria magnacalcarata]CAF4885495.1 unnamed protein product [Rotaria socialis]
MEDCKHTLRKDPRCIVCSLIADVNFYIKANHPEQIIRVIEKEFVTSIEKDFADLREKNSFGERKINMIRTIVGEDLKSIIEKDVQKLKEDYENLKHVIDSINVAIEICKSNKQL